MASPRAFDSTVNVTPGTPPPPVRPPVNPSLSETNQVLDITSLNANGGAAARFTNLTHANIVANTNLSAQNAVANQQAHAQLAVSVLGKAVNNVQNLGPLEARASVDVLTDNAVADEIAGLRAAIDAFSGGGVGPVPNWAKLLALLLKLAAKIEWIIVGNDRLAGEGTLADPYALSYGPIYLKAEITAGFPGQSSVNFSVDALKGKSELVVGS